MYLYIYVGPTVNREISSTRIRTAVFILGNTSIEASIGTEQTDNVQIALVYFDAFTAQNQQISSAGAISFLPGDVRSSIYLTDESVILVHEFGCIGGRCFDFWCCKNLKTQI